MTKNITALRPGTDQVAETRRVLGEVEVQLELRRVLPATPDVVFEAWTRPELMMAWLAPKPMTTPVARVDLREGGAYRVEMQASDGTRFVATGTYLEVIPGERLVFTWGQEGPGRVETLVTIELHRRGDETELVLRHARFISSEQRDSHREGWGSALEKLAELVARTAPARGAAHP
jgi:uncharacterized protein YndB with AHSA1/START domain